MTGIIVKALSGFYYVESEGKVYECKARGSFRKSGISPLVGDRVEWTAVSETQGVVEEIAPRKNSVSRPPVANIDKLFIVSAYSSPRPNTLLIDKMTVLAEYNRIEPVIVFNKCDMGSFEEFESIYKRAGFKVITVSAHTGHGTEELKEELKGCVSAFTGNSGVGKSSLINSLLGDNIISTGELSEKLGRGRHTTRHTQIYSFDFGGYVVDTPGFSSLEFDGNDYELKEKLPFLFRDFEQFLPNCRFTSCTHTKENGCGVLEAINKGDIEKTRHDSYLALFEELKNAKFWESKKSK